MVHIVVGIVLILVGLLVAPAAGAVLAMSVSVNRGDPMPLLIGGYATGAALILAGVGIAWFWDWF